MNLSSVRCSLFSVVPFRQLSPKNYVIFLYGKIQEQNKRKKQEAGKCYFNIPRECFLSWGVKNMAPKEKSLSQFLKAQIFIFSLSPWKDASR